MTRAHEQQPVAVDASLPARIDRLCDAFEGAWKRSESPRLENYLGELGELPAAAVSRAFRELLAVEMAYRHRAGQDATAEEFRIRFPRMIQAIDEMFGQTVVRTPGLEPTLDLKPPTRPFDRPAEQPAGESPAAGEPAVGAATSSGLRFRPLRSHARGGLGEVLVAEDRELRREVALKQIQSQFADDAECRARFVLEAEVTGRLEHPGIVPVYGLGTYANGRPYYAMRFIRGDSLKDAIERFHATRSGRLSPGEKALQLRKLLGRFIDICDAMEYAHSLGIVHRDLKPANVMLGKYGETLVVDWGLAKVIGQPEPPSSTRGRYFQRDAVNDSETREGAIIGTPQYMSPEQAAGHLDRIGPKSDVYGLGATLYCLLTGRPPLAHEPMTVDEMLFRVERGRIPFPRQLNPWIPKPLDAICRKAMALQPDDRYASASAMADDLEKWLADEPIAARPDRPLQRVARWIRRHRALAAATAITLLVVSVVSIAAFVLVNRQRQIADQLAEDNGRLANQERAAKGNAEIAFRQARDAVDDLFTTVSEDTLLNQPGMQVVRKDLLHKALEYYKRFLDLHADDPAVKEEWAATQFRAGRIIDEIESPADAVPYLRRAALVQERLLDDTAHDPHRIQALGDTQNALGRALHRDQQFGEALAAYQKAKDLRQQLVDQAPRDKEYQRALANSIMNIGLVDEDNGDLDAARRQYQLAQQIRSTQLTDGADNLKLQRDYAMGAYNQGVLELKKNAPGDADQHFDESIERFEKLVKRDPRDLNMQFQLALCYRLSADIHSNDDSKDESRRLYEAAQKGFRHLANRSPDVADYQAALAGVYFNQARLQEPAAAMETFDKALALFGELADKHPDNPQFRRDLAATRRTLAELQFKADKREEAGQNLRASLDELTKLVERYPGHADFAEELAKSRQAWRAAFKDTPPPP